MTATEHAEAILKIVHNGVNYRLTHAVVQHAILAAVQAAMQDARDQALDSTPPSPEVWRSISDAPKGDDDTSILVCNANYKDMMEVVYFDPAKPPYCWATADGPSFHLEAFTHWMPLPAPPLALPTQEQAS